MVLLAIVKVTKMSKSKLIIGIPIGIIVILVFGFLSYTTRNKEEIIKNNPHSIELKTQPRLEDDFYDNINFELLKTNNIPKDEYIWYYFYSDASKQIEEEKNES